MSMRRRMQSQFNLHIYFIILMRTKSVLMNLRKDMQNLQCMTFNSFFLFSFLHIYAKFQLILKILFNVTFFFIFI